MLMNGIERIIQRIDAQTQAEIDSLLSEAQTAAGQTLARFQAQAARESAARKQRNELAAAEQEERLVSAAQMEARKTLLSVRQELVERAFDLALEKLCAMPDQDYIAAAARLLAQAAPDGKGAAVFSAKDRARVGRQAVEEANRLLGPDGHLTLSPETREIRGGFILSNGSIEVNCTFETLVRLQRGTMSGETAKLLFSEA